LIEPTVSTETKGCEACFLPEAGFEREHHHLQHDARQRLRRSGHEGHRKA